jgi:hypothetical protein
MKVNNKVRRVKYDRNKLYRDGKIVNDYCNTNACFNGDMMSKKYIVNYHETIRITNFWKNSDAGNFWIYK